MSHWNYRILAKKIQTEKHSYVEFGIYEVYYDEVTNIPNGFTANTVGISSYEGECDDEVDSILWQLEAMKNATEKPVLDYNNFPKEYIKYTRKKKLKEIDNLK